MFVDLIVFAAVHRPHHVSRGEQREPISQRWDALAACESSQRWHIATPPFYGGLQITLETWRAFGGDHYAERPDLATKAQQIRVAEHILAGQGAGAWPVCSQKTGAL